MCCVVGDADPTLDWFCIRIFSLSSGGGRNALNANIHSNIKSERLQLMTKRQWALIVTIDWLFSFSAFQCVPPQSHEWLYGTPNVDAGSIRALLCRIEFKSFSSILQITFQHHFSFLRSLNANTCLWSSCCHIFPPDSDVYREFTQLNFHIFKWLSAWGTAFPITERQDWMRIFIEVEPDCSSQWEDQWREKRRRTVLLNRSSLSSNSSSNLMPLDVWRRRKREDEW